MGSPMPVPLSLVVKIALKAWFACCGGNPTPLSLTEIMSSTSFDTKFAPASHFFHGIDAIEHEIHENLPQLY
jgi:hypothetical protein